MLKETWSKVLFCFLGKKKQHKRYIFKPEEVGLLHLVRQTKKKARC